MKRLFIFPIAIILLFSSCNFDTEANILKKLEKHLDKYTSYSTELKMKTIMDNKESQYKMKESYTLGNKYRLEILEPVESKGIIIQYDGNKIYIQNATIKQSISINSVKNFDQGLLIGKFFRNRDSIKSIIIEEINGTEYYVFHNKVEDKNKYNHEQLIYLKKKDFTPYMLKIIDGNENPRVIIEYMNFKYTND